MKLVLKEKTFIFQLIITYSISCSIYMIFAFHYSDPGINGFFGGIIIQPIMGNFFSFLTLLLCFLIGLPLRINNKINSWWKKNYYISGIFIICGLLVLYLSAQSFFEKTVIIKENGVEMVKNIPNSILNYSGWFLIPFSALHFYIPQKKPI